MSQSKRKKNTQGQNPPKVNKFKLWALIVIVTLVIVIAGLIPLSGFMLNLYRDNIQSFIDQAYHGSITFSEIKGNIASGLVFEDIYFYPEGDEIQPAIWSGDKLTLYFRLLPLFTGKLVVKKAVLEGFVLPFKQDKNGKILIPQLIPEPVNAQGGRFDLGNIGIVIKDSKIIYEENNNHINSPLRFVIDNIKASTYLHKNGKLKINRFKCSFLGSKVAIKGHMETQLPFNANLQLDIIKIGLWQLADSLGRLFPCDRKLMPAGDGEISVVITGPILDPKIEGKCYLKDATIGNFYMEDAHLKVKYMDKHLEVKEGVAKAYGGRIALSGKVDASVDPPEFEIDAEVLGFGFGRYINELQCGVNPVSGSFDGKFHGKGDFENLASFSGKGELRCDNGMYLNPFKDAKARLMEPRQKPEMGFKHLQMDFSIRNSTLKLNTFVLDSSSFAVNASGDIAFDGVLDIEGTLTAESELFKANRKFAELYEILPVRNIKIPVEFKLKGSPSDYQLVSAFSRETIEKFLGDDEERIEAATALLEKYFGDTNTGITDAITSIIPDIN